MFVATKGEGDVSSVFSSQSPNDKSILSFRSNHSRLEQGVSSFEPRTNGPSRFSPCVCHLVTVWDSLRSRRAQNDSSDNWKVDSLRIPLEASHVPYKNPRCSGLIAKRHLIKSSQGFYFLVSVELYVCRLVSQSVNTSSI